MRKYLFLKTSDRPLDAVRRYLFLGLSLTILLVFGLGGWAVATEIAGAVIASGHVVVESNVKKIQHPTGGVIGEIDVKEGQPVKAGQVLVRLDPTVTFANLSIIENTLDQLSARRVRLEAERDGLDSVPDAPDLKVALPKPSPLTDNATLPRVSSQSREDLAAAERRLFELRREARAGQKSQLHERIEQLEEEISGQLVQKQAKEQEITLIKSELEGVGDLYRKQLVPLTRVTSLQREAARLQGELGLLIAGTSSAKGKISEIKLQIIQIDQDLRSEVAKELREIGDKTSEFFERQVAASDQVRRVDIRAPQDGVVHDLTVFTIGGVINPGEAIMTIVPDRDALAIDVRIAPQDISHVHPGQPVMLRLEAFDQRTTPELQASIDRIGADLTVDARSGQSYYTARIVLTQEEVAKLGDKPLVPGMPVEAFIKTGDRSVMSFLTKPFTDQLRKAFRQG